MIFLHGIFNQVWMMDAAYAANYLPLVVSYIKGNNAEVKQERTFSDSFRIAVASNQGYELSDYGSISSPEDAPAGSIAVINITGAITKHDQECGPAGMQTKSNLLRRCYANQNIKGILLNIDSGGGSGDAMRLMAETISERNKPVIAFIDDNACSAAYGIASACDYVVANNTLAYVGSIGTYLSIVDYTEYFKKEGINLIEVYASASKDKNAEVREAIKGNTEPLRKLADRFNEAFIQSIEKNRSGKLTAGREAWGTGKLLHAEDALKLGLIDEINTFSNTLNSFV